jgi:hypothetical protein
MIRGGHSGEPPLKMARRGPRELQQSLIDVGILTYDRHLYKSAINTGGHLHYRRFDFRI